jgi:hypothetical protein
MFGADEQASLNVLEKFQQKGDTFRLLRESGSASTFYSRLALLISSLESIAGSKTTGSRIETDKNFIRIEILRDDTLYKELFDYGAGLRNKLFHGDRVLLKGDRQYIEEIYRAIVRFFNEKCGTKISQRIVNPMRHIIANYEVLNIFLRTATGQVPGLRELMLDADEWRQHGGSPTAKYQTVRVSDSY